MITLVPASYKGCPRRSEQGRWDVMGGCIDQGNFPSRVRCSTSSLECGVFILSTISTNKQHDFVRTQIYLACQANVNFQCHERLGSSWRRSRTSSEDTQTRAVLTKTPAQKAKAKQLCPTDLCRPAPLRPSRGGKTQQHKMDKLGNHMMGF